MSRIRSIKPQFFRSSKISQLEPYARLLFVGMWTEADDAGRGVAEPKHLAGTLFAFDRAVTEKKIRHWLKAMASRNLIQLYNADGAEYFAITNWNEHQKINRPQPAIYPAPPTDTKVDASFTESGAANGDTHSVNGRHKTQPPFTGGREGKGEEPKTSPDGAEKPRWSARLAEELQASHGVQVEPADTRHGALRNLLAGALRHFPDERHHGTTIGLIADYVEDVQGWQLTREARNHTARLVRLHAPLEVFDAFGQALQWGAGIGPEYAKDSLALSKYVAGVITKRRVK